MEEHPPISPEGSPPPPPPPVSPASLPLPWEQPGYPALAGMVETVRLFLTKPFEAYERMSKTIGLGRPFFYAFVLGWLALIIGGFYRLLLHGIYDSIPGMQGRAFPIPPGAFFAINVFAGPFVIPVALFVFTALVHFFLMLFGGSKGGFWTTFRVMCYATTPTVLVIVPICGGIVSGFWEVFLATVGLAIAHPTTKTRAFLSQCAVFLLCCGCFLPFMFLAGMKHMWHP